VALTSRTSGRCHLHSPSPSLSHFHTTGTAILSSPHPSHENKTHFTFPPPHSPESKTLSLHPLLIRPLRKHAAHTYLGTTISGYPNLFHLYGPQAPTLLSNGPTSVEMQGRWIVDCIKQIRSQNLKYIDPKKEASLRWKQRINDLSDASLFPTTKSTYMGGSMEGKAFEMTCYAGGIPQYVKEIRSVLPELTGFRVVKA
jgi:hypothetical protein